MPADRCATCDHRLSVHTPHGGCQFEIIVPSVGKFLCQCVTRPPKARCKAIEGATGIGCSNDAGHHTNHRGKHTPRTDGTESIGYWLLVEWPYTEHDEELGIKPGLD